MIRIRAPYPNEARVRFHDVIKGDLDLPANDQDTVLLKSNSLPTYHFAHVVDDTLMHVTTIIRGEEWLPSAPLHIQIFEYLGVPLPDFAHIAPIAKMDGSSKRKLSKRKDPEANMAYYAEVGYPAQAVIEYLLNLANSSFYDWQKANPDKPYTEFPFRLEDMGVAMPLFDMVKLNDISKDVVATYSAEQVYEYAVAWAEQYDPRLAQHPQIRPGIQRRRVQRRARGARAAQGHRQLVGHRARVRLLFRRTLRGEQSPATAIPMPPVDAADIAAILEHVRGVRPAVPKDAWLDDMRGLAERLGFAPQHQDIQEEPRRVQGAFRRRDDGRARGADGQHQHARPVRNPASLRQAAHRAPDRPRARHRRRRRQSGLIALG